MIGKTIAHYKILQKLGEGGMGVVYKAHDTKLDRTVALKFLPAHLSASEDDKTRFLQEARAAASLTHPNICTIFAIEEYTEEGEPGSRFFFAMEYLEGKTLRHSMNDIGIQRALDIGHQAAEGLAAAHEKGIVHRDIKAENIMARPDGRVQIMDFGLAKVRGGSALTKAGSTVGTIGYMSPEQIQGMDVDHRADIFSLGVLLYEMASGALPFKGVHDAAIMYEIVNVQPPPPSEIKNSVPAELDRIIGKCLAKDRDDRYQSARDIAVDLKILRKQSGSGISSGTAGGMQRPASSGSRPAIPQPAAPSSGAVETQPSGVTSSGVQPTGADPRGSGITPPPNRKPLMLAVAAFVIFALAAVLWFFTKGDSSSMIASMVVLPFENVGNNPDLEYLSEGVTEGIINKVSRIPNLRVIPRSAAFRFKGSTKDPKAIGDELGVDAVLSGRLVQRGDRLDVTLELMDVKAYSQIWGESYKRTMNDLMTVQDEIVGAVEGRIRPESGPAAAANPATETKDPVAYKLYLQGKYYWNKRTAPDLEKALSYFQQAVALDPSYARAHLGAAETYLLQGQYSDKRSANVLAMAESEALKSLALDNSLGEAHAALGMVRERYWDWQGAEKEFKLAIEKAPAYATSYHWYSIYLSMIGKQSEALSVIQKGAELDPYSPIILVNLAIGYINAGDMTAAGEVLRKIQAIDPLFFFSNVWLTAVYEAEGRKAEAIRNLDRLELRNLSSNQLGFVGHYYGELGLRAKADSLLRVLILKSVRDNSDPVAVAMVYCGLGNADSAMVWLGKAFNQADKSQTLPNTRSWREFGLVHNDPRYIALMKTVGIM